MRKDKWKDSRKELKQMLELESSKSKEKMGQMEAGPKTTNVKELLDYMHESPFLLILLQKLDTAASAIESES